MKEFDWFLIINYTSMYLLIFTFFEGALQKLDVYFQLEGVHNKSAQAQNLAIDEKFTILIKSS